MSILERLTPLIREAICSHAEAAMPIEACGLLIASRATGALAYLTCRNVFPNGQDRFEISPDDWVACEELGEPVAVVHSHPNASANPSMADRVGCERSGLPWLVIGMPSGVMKEVLPCGWQAPYEGRDFSHGVLDCYTLIQDWYLREPDLQIELPDFEREDDWWKGDADLYLQHMAEAGFHAVHGPLQRHDVILMGIRARKANHGAIYKGDGVILHHLMGRKSCTDIYGGYWERNTVLVARHWTRIPGAAKP
jgi:proteasome lid subunit RPN8/RPN11